MEEKRSLTKCFNDERRSPVRNGKCGAFILAEATDARVSPCLFTYQTNCLFNCMPTGVNATQSRDEVFTLTIYI